MDDQNPYRNQPDQPEWETTTSKPVALKGFIKLLALAFGCSAAVLLLIYYLPDIPKILGF